MKKTLQATNELFIQFSDEEVQEFGLEQGQRYDVTLTDDGSVKLTPWSKVEIDIEDYPREVLEMIIKESLDKDITVNDVINNLLKEGLSNLENQEVCCGGGCGCDHNELKSVHGYSEHDAVLPTAWNDNTTASSDIQLSTNSRLDADTIITPTFDPETINADTSIVNDSYKFSVENDMLFNPEQK